MALKLVQSGREPIGQMDGYDADFLTIKGGEIVTFGSVLTSGQPGVTAPGFDKSAFDGFDGYVNPAALPHRPVVTHTFCGTGVLAGVSVASRPLMLADDGIVGYGTLFGSVVGGTAGQQVNGPNTFTGPILGPHTATGSGKITCWEKPGLYAVTLDAVDTAVDGLVPTNTTLNVGAAVTFTCAGLLTPAGSAAATTSGAPNVARLVEFATNGSLVTTPNFLVSSLNSPSGNVSSLGPRQFSEVVIYFNPPLN